MTPSEQRELKSVFYSLVFKTVFYFKYLVFLLKKKQNLFCCLDFSKKAFFFLKNRVEKRMYREVSIILAVDLFINCVRKMDICRHHDFTHCSVKAFPWAFLPSPFFSFSHSHQVSLQRIICLHVSLTTSINRIYGLLIFPSLVSVTLSSYMSCSTLTHFTYTYLKADVTSKKLIWETKDTACSYGSSLSITQ